MICPFEKNMETPGAVGLIRKIFMINPIAGKNKTKLPTASGRGI